MKTWAQQSHGNGCVAPSSFYLHKETKCQRYENVRDLKSPTRRRQASFFSLLEETLSFLGFH